MAGVLSFLVCLALSAALAAGAYRKAQRHDGRGATRMAAWALVPVGLDLAGFVRLGRKVGDAIGHWAVNLVFNPLVWIGMVMLGIAILTFIITGLTEPDEVDEAPAAVPAKQRKAVGPGKQRQAAPASGEDAEIEAILRKHGVS